jgi:hypothetical protein
MLACLGKVDEMKNGPCGSFKLNPIDIRRCKNDENNGFVGWDVFLRGGGVC